MWDLLNTLSSLGCSLDDNLLYATIKKNKEGWIVSSYGKADVKRLDIHYSKETLVAASLDSSLVLQRPLEIKLTKKKDIEAVLPFEAEPLLPFPVEDAFLSYQLLRGEQKSSVLTLFAVKKDAVKETLSAYAKYDIDPENLIPESVALASFSKTVTNESSTFFTIHLGKTKTICLLQKGGIPLGLSTIARGFNSLTTETEGTFKLEIERALLALSKQFKTSELGGCLLTGDFFEFPELQEALLQDIKLEPLPLKSTLGLEEKILYQYALPIGTALATALGEKIVDFRQHEFSYPHPWQRFLKPLIFFFAASVLLAFSIFLLGQTILHKRLDSIKENWADLLYVLEKPYTETETTWFRHAKPLESLTMADLEERFFQLQSELGQTPETFLLYPDVPRLSDFLAWLATHPQVVSNSGQKPQIDIRSLQYNLVKRPDQKKKNEKYLVKVDLEFQTETPKEAREFHDALLAPNDFVDPKNEVKWSVSGKSYHVSFFLKNRPPKMSDSHAK